MRVKIRINLCHLEELSGSGEQEANDPNMAGEASKVERDVTAWFAGCINLGRFWK